MRRPQAAPSQPPCGPAAPQAAAGWHRPGYHMPPSQHAANALCTLHSAHGNATCGGGHARIEWRWRVLLRSARLSLFQDRLHSWRDKVARHRAVPESWQPPRAPWLGWEWGRRSIGSRAAVRRRRAASAVRRRSRQRCARISHAQTSGLIHQSEDKACGADQRTHARTK